MTAQSELTEIRQILDIPGDQTVVEGVGDLLARHKRALAETLEAKSAVGQIADMLGCAAGLEPIRQEILRLQEALYDLRRKNNPQEGSGPDAIVPVRVRGSAHLPTLWRWLPGAAWTTPTDRGRVVEGGPPPPEDAVPVRDDDPTQATLRTLVRRYWPRAVAAPAVGWGDWIASDYPRAGLCVQIAIGPTEWDAYEAALRIAEDREVEYACALESWWDAHAEVGLSHMREGGTAATATAAAMAVTGPAPTRESFGLPPEDHHADHPADRRFSARWVGSLDQPAAHPEDGDDLTLADLYPDGIIPNDVRALKVGETLDGDRFAATLRRTR